MAQAEEDKDRAIRMNEATRADFMNATSWITELTSEKEELNKRITELEVALSKSQLSVDAKESEIDRLSDIILKIEEDKVKNFETKLILARRHIENFSGWEQINWKKFRVPSNVKSPIPPYFS